MSASCDAIASSDTSYQRTRFRDKSAQWLAKESLEIAVFGSKGACFQALIDYQVWRTLRWPDTWQPIRPDYREFG
jgi:hypothetical protein